MAIVDSVRDTLSALQVAFNKVKKAGAVPAKINFVPVACLKEKNTNLYEMFCLCPNGQRLIQVESLEYRPTITGSTSVQLVRWEREWKRYVKISE